MRVILRTSNGFRLFLHSGLFPYYLNRLSLTAHLCKHLDGIINIHICYNDNLPMSSLLSGECI